METLPAPRRAGVAPSNAIDALGPQAVAVTILGAYLRPRDGAITAGGLVRLLADLGFSEGSSRVAFTRLVTRKHIERRRAGSTALYTLGVRGRDLLAEGDRRIFSFGASRGADEPWTVLWHAVPSTRRAQRARLARRLRFLGFGPLQDGTWIAAHDRELEVTSLLDRLDVAEYASVLVGRPAASTDFRPVVERAWDLEGLSRRYEDFVAEFRPFLSERARRSISDRRAFIGRTRLVHLYRGFPMLDPEIEPPLAPEPAFREEAIGLFGYLYDSLAEPAQRYFDEVTGRSAARPRGG